MFPRNCNGFATRKTIVADPARSRRSTECSRSVSAVHTTLERAASPMRLPSRSLIPYQSTGRRAARSAPQSAERKLRASSVKALSLFHKPFLHLAMYLANTRTPYID
ncbi:hypothetical protein COCON_G00023810 [Conger conger]|uniref:Uncharacterized protein n=1 Tax=Conger conger TaxID=82655 RepID=A0A9Q1I6H0_CONCO|nr:hypothetical protein COCON_G00023810 [Conger conger]